MTKIKSYPFPIRNTNHTDEKIFYHKLNTRENTEFYYKKITNSDAITIANQFFLIESILMESFQYVSPIRKNGNTCSVKFATIIRESSNLFEVVSKKAYSEFFVSNGKNIDIKNYLSLDAFLNFSTEEVKAPILESFAGNNLKIEPFKELKNWNQKEEIKSEHIPQWWTSYNKIKHDTESVNNVATLENAIYSLAGAFILIQKIYGDGLICGRLKKAKPNLDETYHLAVKSSEIFIEHNFKTQGF